MTKKEQLELDSLREQLRIAKALRFTEEVKPDVMPPGRMSDGLTKGFLYNAYGDGRIAPACSSSMSHNFGSDKATQSKDARPLYSTRLLALRGLRHAVELECAKRLAGIDKQIDQELANQ